MALFKSLKNLFGGKTATGRPTADVDGSDEEERKDGLEGRQREGGNWKFLEKLTADLEEGTRTKSATEQRFVERLKDLERIMKKASRKSFPDYGILSPAIESANGIVRGISANVFDATRYKDKLKELADWARQLEFEDGFFPKHVAPQLDHACHLLTMPADTAAIWCPLEQHVWETDLNKSSPSKKWLQEAQSLVVEADKAVLVAQLLKRLDKAKEDARYLVCLSNGHRGLIWMAVDWPFEELAPALVDFAARHCYVTVQQHEFQRGIQDEKLGNAVVWYLANLPDGAGVPYLSQLLERVKYPKVKKKINAALNDAAEAAGISRGALDEASMRDHGLDADGRAVFPLGDGAALVSIVATSKVLLQWRTADGKATKTVPTALKELKDEIKGIRKTAKEIEADLSTQPPRLQRIWLEDRRWSAQDWIARYADHPLLSQMSRRLIWNAHHGETRVSGLWRDGAFLDVAGSSVDLDGAEISLWHPLDDQQEGQAWRDRLMELEITQPFKQAHREIYVITDAERATATYSNRFAGHILKQHQMMTLARINNWKITHRMWVDAPNDEPTHLVIPAHGLIAEYWTEGAGGDDPEVSDSGAYSYITTDQLRFYRIDPDGNARGSGYDAPRGDIMELEDVPALVFSEVMRQCDLFVGVASIANDPNWVDSGADAEHPGRWRRDVADRYWRDTGFGELTETAETRKALLEKLLPGLAIGKQCVIDGKFLKVTGKKRVYKIHLGSSNILMTPHGKYLCIVPGQAKPGEKSAEKVRLPFEGDRTLSMILSKAFLLAADDKIKDPVILNQIE